MRLTISFLCSFLCLVIVQTLHKASHQLVAHSLSFKEEEKNVLTFNVFQKYI